MSPRALIISTSPHAFGSERSLLTFLSSLSERQRAAITCVLPCGEGELATHISDLGIDSCRIPISTSPRKDMAAFLKFVFKINLIAREFRASTVYGNNSELSLALAFARLVAGFRFRTILHIRDVTWTPWRHYWGRAMFLHSRLIFNSFFLQRQNLPPPVCMTAARSEVIHNFVNWHPPINHEQPQAAGSPVLGMFGRCRPDKGFLFVLEALAERPEIAKALGGIIISGISPVCDDEYIKQMRRCIADSPNLRARVRLSNFASNPWPLIAQCDIVAIPSVMESFGRVAIEAGVLGKCVLATNVGGLREVLRHGVTGLLWEPTDAEHFSHMLEAVIGDSTLRKSLGSKLAAEVAERFDKRRLASRLAATLQLPQ